MVKRFEIWDSRIDMEKWKDFIEEDKEINPHLHMTENESYQRIYEINDMYLDDERCNLDKRLSNPILVIADLGLWNGRKCGYRIIESGNLKDILSRNGEMAEWHWFCDGYNIRCDYFHHDGTNHYIYREIKNPENIETFLDMLYYGKDWKKHLNRYTRSLASDIGKIYGLCA